MVVHAHKIFFRAARQKEAEQERAAERALVAERLAGIAKSAGGPETDKPPERRKSERKSVFLQAQLITESLDCIHCNVVDLSADGARIALAGNHDVSRYVTLKYERSGITKKARVAWRHNNELGLAFRADEKTSDIDEEQAPAA